MIDVEVTGDWELAERILNASDKILERALKKAVHQESIHFEALVIDKLSAGPPPPLSPWTVATRKKGQGKGGDKPLNASGDMLGSVKDMPDHAALEKFIGIPRSAPGHNGDVVRLAEIHEFGVTFTVRVTPKMRKFLFASMPESMKGAKHPTGSGKKFLVIHIPARPFIRPAFEEGAREALPRFEARLFKLLEPVMKGTASSP